MTDSPPAAEAPFVLYAHPRSGNAYKPALMLSLCNRRFEFRLVDLPAGEQQGEAYRAVNRYGQVPTLVHGDLALVQSNAIVQYLSDSTGCFATPDPLARQRVREWLFWEQDMLFPGIGRTRFFTRVTRGDPGLVAWLRSVGERALGHLEARLSESAFLVGVTPSVADIVVYCYARLAEEADFDLVECPAVVDWRRRIEALPGWAPPRTLMPLD